MILIIDLCYEKDSLSTDEFVTPIVQIVQKSGAAYTVRHYRGVTEADVSGADRVILCGTALMDNGFLLHPEAFAWITTFSRPLLGICAGMEILSVLFGGAVQESREIGMTEVRCTGSDPLFAVKDRFVAYELHRFAPQPSGEFMVLAESDRCTQAVRHTSLPFYGVMFHPEVRNDWVVERFLTLQSNTADGSICPI